MAAEKNNVGVKSLLNVPQEIFEQIVGQKCLNLGDLYHLLISSKWTNNGLNSNELWKVKLLQRWPTLSTKLEKKARADWKEQCQIRLNCSAVVWREVAFISRSCYDKEEIGVEDCHGLFAEVDRSDNGFLFVVDELMAIIHAENRKKNLTHRYYANKVLRLVQQHFLISTLSQYLDLNPEHQTLEKGSVIIACWCQPTIDYLLTVDSVQKELDSIAECVQNQVKVDHPNHPVCAISVEGEQFTGLLESAWSPSNARVILTALNNVLFSHLGFRGNDGNYYDMNNSYINQVLAKKTGIPISMCVVYMSVAKRLGVLCRPINFPQHFLLSWLEHPELEGEEQYTYIDVFNRGKFLNAVGCRAMLMGYLDSSCFTPVSGVEVLQRMVRNLYSIARQQEDEIHFLCDILLLTILLDRKNVQEKMLLAKLYLRLNINLDEAETLFEDIEMAASDMSSYVSYMKEAIRLQKEHNSKTDSAEILAKKRSENPAVEYSVGLIMKHRRYNYKCVIYGWDKTCRASQEWIHHMGVHNLPHAQWQPFYNVLVEDGSKRYAAQENLDYCLDPSEISQSQVSKYFDEFADTHYVLSEMLHEHYPEDMEYTLRAVAELQQRDQDPHSDSDEPEQAGGS